MGRVGVLEVRERADSDVEVSILLLVKFRGCMRLAVGVWMVARGRSWSVGNNSSRKGLENSECEEELAQRLLMVSGEPDRNFDARPY